MSTLIDDADVQYWQIDSSVITGVPVTIMFFGYLDADPGSNDFCGVQIGDKDTTNNYFRLGTDEPTGKVQGATVSATQTRIVQTTTTPVINTWEHFACVFAAVDSRSAFHNGAGKATNTGSSTPTGFNRTSVGQEGDSTEGDEWSGRLARVVVYNVALTDAEVKASAAGISPLLIRPTALKHWWEFLDGTSGRDWIGALDLTAFGSVGSPVTAPHPPIAPPFGFGQGWEGAFTAAVGVTVAEIMAAASLDPPPEPTPAPAMVGY